MSIEQENGFQSSVAKIKVSWGSCRRARTWRISRDRSKMGCANSQGTGLSHSVNEGISTGMGDTIKPSGHRQGGEWERRFPSWYPKPEML